ncbi:3480_t:CDS:2, partial [Dentiscutata erythropus]
NTVKLEDIINEVLLEIQEEKKMIVEDKKGFIEWFKNIYLQKKVPIGVLTEKTKFPSNNHMIARKLTNKLHHKIIVKIKEQIWWQSRIELNEYPVFMTNYNTNWYFTDLNPYLMDLKNYRFGFDISNLDLYKKPTCYI